MRSSWIRVTRMEVSLRILHFYIYFCVVGDQEPFIASHHNNNKNKIMITTHLPMVGRNFLSSTSENVALQRKRAWWLWPCQFSLMTSTYPDCVRHDIAPALYTGRTGIRGRLFSNKCTNISKEKERVVTCNSFQGSAAIDYLWTFLEFSLVVGSWNTKRIRTTWVQIIISL
jgi:hypothetical protein